MISSSAASAGATAAGAGATAAEGVAGAAGASFSGEVAGAEVVALGAPAGGTGVAGAAISPSMLAEHGANSMMSASSAAGAATGAGARGAATALGADDASAWDAASAALPLCGTGGFECVRWSAAMAAPATARTVPNNMVCRCVMSAPSVQLQRGTDQAHTQPASKECTGKPKPSMQASRSNTRKQCTNIAAERNARSIAHQQATNKRGGIPSQRYRLSHSEL